MSQDTTPRYTPNHVLLFSRVTGKPVRAPVTSVIAHPPGTIPWIRADLVCVELVTDHGSRKYGVESAHIDASLRMVVQGFPAGFEELAAWEVAPHHQH